jgi:hypothetical protein
MRRWYVASASLVIVLITVRLGAQTCSQCSPTLHSGFSKPTVVSISAFGDVPGASQTGLNEAVAKWNTYLGQIGSSTRFQVVSNNNSSAFVGVYIEPTMSGTLQIANNQGALTNNNGSSNLLLNPDFASDLDIMEQNMLHELGHNLGFEDVFTSGCNGQTVMYWSQNGSSSTELTDCDKAALLNCYAPPPPPGGGGGPSGGPNPDGGGYNEDMPCFPGIDAWCSPIVINFENGGYQLTGKNAPVLFDIRGDGHPLLMGWTAAGADEAFLWLDRNHNHTVTSGVELFGNFTLLNNGLTAKNGFEALAEFDTNHDGILDERDPIWPELLLWRDLNHNGISEPDEISTLDSSDVTAIDLQYHWAGRQDQWGNDFRYQSKISMRDRAGRAVRYQPVYDIFFVSVPK